LAEGTPLRIAVDQRTRLSRTGEVVHGRVAEDVFAFDQVVIPAGSVATGTVTRIEPVSARRHAMAYANGNFSPFHKYEITFDCLTLPDGRQIAVQTKVSPGVAEVVRLVSHPEESGGHKKSAPGRAISNAGRQGSDTVHEAVGRIRSPRRLERLKR